MERLEIRHRSLPGGLSPLKIMSRKMGAPFTGSLNYSICRTFRELTGPWLRPPRERIRVTPPIKPYLEEKMWFALFWMQPLREFWRRELGEKYFAKLQEVIPYSWLLDPTPLPQHAVIPRLEIHDWREAARLSQKDRDLLLKVSGFSPLGWGSRGIALGSDLSHAEWEHRIEHALATFDTEPTIMQRFHKGRLFDHPYWNPDSGELETMKGRVRLCPYYFVERDRVKLRGALATIVPADKKFLHGMRDAVMVPSRIAEHALRERWSSRRSIAAGNR